MVFPGGGWRSGTGGVRDPQNRTCSHKNSLEWPRGRIFLKSLGSDGASFQDQMVLDGPQAKSGHNF